VKYHPNVNIYDTGDAPLRIARKCKVMAVIGLLEQHHARE
jgi:hypothetical protein